MSDRIRWGILGTGKIARILARALAASSSGELVAVASRTPERAQGFAAELAVPRHHGDYSALLDDDEVDLVFVATHHPAHREWATKSAEAGKHVLCEKPLAVRREDAAVIVDAARRNGVFLAEAFAYQFHPQTHRLLGLVRDGAIGEIRMIDAVFGYDAGPSPANYLLVRELAGGSILDVGCYTTSMSHLVAAAALGADAVEAAHVTGSACIGPMSQVDHWAAAEIVFEGAILARVASAIQVNLDSSVRIYGSEGRITVPSPWLPGRIGTRATILVERYGVEPEEVEIGLEADVYTIEVDAVGGLIRDGGREPPVLTWEGSLANMRTLDRWRAAIGLRYDADEEPAGGPVSAEGNG